MDNPGKPLLAFEYKHVLSWRFVQCPVYSSVTVATIRPVLPGV